MGLIKTTIFLLCAIVSLTANAEDRPVLLNYEQLMDLSVSIRADYIRALRLALVDIEMDQRKEETISSSFSLFSQAFAADITDQCIFAGWVGTFSAPIDGHRYCHAPSESLSGCGGGEMKCNPAIFGDVPCVKRDTFATSTCDTRAASSEDVAKAYLSNAELKKSWDKLAGAIEGICAITTRQQSPCQRINRRLKVIAEKANLPAPKPYTKVDPAKKSIDKVTHQDGTSTEKPPCKANRDKGPLSWGTCHAFCTLCTLDRLAAQHNFRTSANWVVFLSAVDRVCSPGSNQPTITNAKQLFGESLKGGDPRFDFEYAVKYGFCSEEDYLPYSDIEPPQTKDHQTQQGLDAHKTGSPTSFANQFGISFENLQKLYCPTGTINLNSADPGYAQRLEGMAKDLGTSDGGQKFLKCARESLGVAQKIKRGDGSLCQTHTKDFTNESPADRAKFIEDAIDKGLPVSIEISSPKTAIPHCVTATAYNKQKQEFDIINSHGTGSDFALYSTDPIKFSEDPKGRKISSYWYVDCGQSASQSSNPASNPASSTSNEVAPQTTHGHHRVH